MSDFSLGPLPFHDGSCRDTGAKYRGKQRQRQRAPDDDGDNGGDSDDDVGDVGGGGGDDGDGDDLDFFVQRQLRSQRIVTDDTLSSKFVNHDHGRAPHVRR